MTKTITCISIILGFILGVIINFSIPELSIWGKIGLSLMAQFAMYGLFSLYMEYID